MKTEPNDPIGNSVTSDGYTGATGVGLTKREYFAGLAMQGLLAKYAMQNTDAKGICPEAVTHADELIEALNKQP